MQRLAEASGIATPTRVELARFDRSRKGKKTSNKDWRSPQDPDAKITKMKDGRTHLAHKAEHGVDLETGAILSVTVQDASAGDSVTLPETLTTAAEQVEAVQPDGDGVEEVVADRDITATRRWSGLRPSACAATSRSRIAAGGTGRARRRRGTRCMPTGGGSAARVGNGCCGSGASYWNGPTRISTRPAGCTASICAGIPTS